MSALYVSAGVCLGVMSAHISGAEASWGWLLVPAACALIAAAVLEHERR